MSERLGRRGLWSSLFGGRDEEPPPATARPVVTPGTSPAGFSLGAFYAAREASEPAPLPHVELRAGLPAVETTRVGLCPEAEDLTHLLVPDAEARS